MTVGRRAEGVVRAVVAYDGQLLLAAQPDGWQLPPGPPEPGENAAATAAHAVYELTGHLVNGSPTVQSAEDGMAAVVCQLLSEFPSEGGTLTRQQIRWAPFAEAVDAEVPVAVRDYLRGHTPS